MVIFAERGRLSFLQATFVAGCIVCFFTGERGFAADHEQLRQEGARHYSAGRYFQAIEAFEKALAGAPEEAREPVKGDLAHALAGLGFEYLSESEGRMAEETFRRAIGVSEDYYANFGLGYLFFTRREDGEARTYLLSSLGSRRDYAPTHKLLGLLDYRKGLTKEAIDRLSLSLRLDPADDESAFLVKRLKSELGVVSTFPSVGLKHFKLRVDPKIPGKLATRLQVELERVYTELGKALGVWPSGKVPVVLYSQGRFYEATGSQHWVGGFYDGQIKLPVPIEVDEKDPAFRKLLEVVRHEYAHLLVLKISAECPMWLNEGIAQYFEASYKRDAVYGRLKESREARIPLKKMPARLGNIDDVELARWVYLQGLGFVEFLAEKYRPFRLRLLLRAIAEEHSAAEAFERVYGRSIEDLEKEWWARVEKPGK